MGAWLSGGCSAWYEEVDAECGLHWKVSAYCTGNENASCRNLLVEVEML